MAEFRAQFFAIICGVHQIVTLVIELHTQFCRREGGADFISVENRTWRPGTLPNSLASTVEREMLRALLDRSSSHHMYHRITAHGDPQSFAI